MDKDTRFGNIKCKECGLYINPIKMHDHLLVCKLQVENEALQERIRYLYDQFGIKTVKEVQAELEALKQTKE